MAIEFTVSTLVAASSEGIDEAWLDSEAQSKMIDGQLRSSIEPGPESSRRHHVASILVAETFDKFCFLGSCSKHKENGRDQPGQQYEPIGSHDASACDGQEERQVERMSDVSIRASGDQRVFSPRYYRVGKISAEIRKRPDQQHAPKSDQGKANPSCPDWDRHK